MSQVEMKMPKMGESVAEATIIKWLKKEGDSIESDEPVLEIATDKVDSDVPSPASGILLKRLFNDGDVVQVGELIALIGSKDEKVIAVPPTASAPVLKEAVSEPAVSQAKMPASLPAVSNGSSDKFYSPLVKS